MYISKGLERHPSLPCSFVISIDVFFWKFQVQRKTQKNSWASRDAYQLDAVLWGWLLVTKALDSDSSSAQFLRANKLSSLLMRTTPKISKNDMLSKKYEKSNVFQEIWPDSLIAINPISKTPGSPAEHCLLSVPASAMRAAGVTWPAPEATIAWFRWILLTHAE